MKSVGVALHETMAIDAPKISKVTVNFRGQETELTDFRATHRCPGSPAIESSASRTVTFFATKRCSVCKNITVRDAHCFGVSWRT